MVLRAAFQRLSPVSLSLFKDFLIYLKIRVTSIHTYTNTYEHTQISPEATMSRLGQDEDRSEEFQPVLLHKSTGAQTLRPSFLCFSRYLSRVLD